MNLRPHTRDLICTAYLTGRPDPQRRRRIPRDSIAYMRPWYDSVRALKLRAIIVHDELSPEFVERYTTDRIAFHHVGPYPWTPNDERFFAWRSLLRARRCGRIFLTDIADVRVVRNPFPLLARAGARLVTGDEVYPWPLGSRIRGHAWLRQKIRETRTPRSQSIYRFFARHRFDLPTLNAGVIGGYTPDVLEFLDRFVSLRRSIGHAGRNLNMPLVNYVLHRFFRGRFRHGAPVTSRFKRYERERRDVWFVHK